MSNFVSDEPVGVTVEGDPNTVYIRPKMDYGTLARVKMRAKEATGGITLEQEANFYIDTWNLVLLEANIIRWEGPDFDGVPLTPDNIRKWNPDAPLLTEVLTRINNFNFRKDGEGTSPNSSTRKSRSASTRKRGART